MIGDKDILKYLEGTLTEDAKSKVDLWVSESPQNKDMFEHTRLLWTESSQAGDFVKFDTKAEWDFFEKNFIDSSAQSANIVQIRPEIEEVSDLKSNTKIEESGAKIVPLNESVNWRNVISIAASLIILVTATWFLWPQSEYIDIVNAENDMEIILDDGTTVEVRKGASLKTLRSYKYATERNALIAGEVNFDVASDPEKPFIVETPETAVRVLGTKFNVISTGIESEVANEEGKVKFYVIEDESQFVDLNPGDRIKYDGEGFIDLNEPPPSEPKPIPKIGEIMDYLQLNFGSNISFGSGLDVSRLSELDIDYEGKTARQIVNLMQEKAIVSYTTSCAGCYQINEIIPFR